MQQYLTKELVVASLLPEIVRLNLDELISVGKQIKVQKETLAANYSDLKRLREMHQLLKKRMDDENQPDKDRIKIRKEGYDTYMKQIEEILEEADPLISEFYHELKEEENKRTDELKGLNGVIGRHLEFVNITARLIVSATEATELTRIQKLIGSEKSKSAFYGDYQEKNEAVCDELIKLVADRKKIMKDNAKIQKDYDTWLTAGDIVKATQLKEQMEFNDRVVSENAKSIADNAYKHVAGVEKFEIIMSVDLISPRLRRWAWRVDDIDIMHKKMPVMVEKVPVKKEINAFMKSKVEEESLDDEKDNMFNGLVIYKKPFFVSIKTTKEDAS